MDKKKRPLYIFSFKIIIFFIILISIISFLIPAIDIKKDDKYEYAFNYLKETSYKDEVDIIFLSNSYIFTGIDPLYLRGLTGLKSIHLGHHGMSLLYHYINLNNALNNFTPEFVVLDVSPQSIKFTFPEQEEVKFFAKKALVHSTPSIEKLTTLFDLKIHKDPSFFLESLSIPTSALVNMNSFEPKKLLNKNKVNTEHYLGFTPLIKRKSKDKKKWGDFNKVFFAEPNNDKPFVDSESLNEKYLLKILDLTKRKNTKVILLNTIKYGPTRGLNKLDSILKKHGYKHVYTCDMNSKRKELKFGIDHFSDMTHLHYSGALKQTKEFSKFLVKNGISKKQENYNNIKFDNETSLKFFNFVNDDNGGRFTQFCVNSKSPNDLKNLDFNFEYYSKGKIIEKLKTNTDYMYSVGEDYIKTQKTPFKFKEKEIDSVLLFLNSRTKRVMNIKPVLDNITEKNGLNFSLKKISDDQYKFEINTPDKNNYEYVIYRYLNKDKINPNHKFKQENYLLFSTDENVNNYHFECFIRPKKRYVKSRKYRVY